MNSTTYLTFLQLIIIYWSLIINGLSGKRPTWYINSNKHLTTSTHNSMSSGNIKLFGTGRFIFNGDRIIAPSTVDHSVGQICVLNQEASITDLTGNQTVSI